MSIDVLLADDHPIIRSGIRNLIRETDDLVVGGEVADGGDLLTQVRRRDWGLLVLDMSMPGIHGIELIHLAKAERPKLPILIFSAQQEDRYAVRAIRSGASGYLPKDSSIELLIPAMRKVAAGGVFVSQKTAELLIADYAKPTDKLPHTQLSKREYDIFIKIIEGKRLIDIANEQSLSIKTVSSHKQHIFKKLHVSSQVDLVRYAIQHNLLEAQEY